VRGRSNHVGQDKLACPELDQFELCTSGKLANLPGSLGCASSQHVNRPVNRAPLQGLNGAADLKRPASSYSPRHVVYTSPSAYGTSVRKSNDERKLVSFTNFLEHLINWFTMVGVHCVSVCLARDSQPETQAGRHALGGQRKEEVKGRVGTSP
jgi:hypothetical protein